MAARYPEFQMNEGNVSIGSKFNDFRSWSQLSDISHGGYLTGSIKVPVGVKIIELALYR